MDFFVYMSLDEIYLFVYCVYCEEGGEGDILYVEMVCVVIDWFLWCVVLFLFEVWLEDYRVNFD